MDIDCNAPCCCCSMKSYKLFHQTRRHIHYTTQLFKKMTFLIFIPFPVPLKLALKIFCLSVTSTCCVAADTTRPRTSSSTSPSPSAARSSTGSSPRYIIYHDCFDDTYIMIWEAKISQNHGEIKLNNPKSKEYYNITYKISFLLYTS